jgi:hypothetical protein
MSNSILTSSVRVPFLAEIESNLPVLANGTVQYNKNFIGGNGSTVDVLVPDYSITTVTNGDLTSNLSDITNATRSVTLTQYTFGVQRSMVENTLALSSFTDQVAKPKGRTFASTLQKLGIDTLKLGAATVSVATAGTYSNIGEGVAALEASRANTDYFGVMSPSIAKKVVDSGLQFFQADLKGSFLNGEVGSYLGCKFYKTQDMATPLTVGAYVATAAAVNQPTAYVAGATALAIDGSTLTGTIVKGMAFTVAGVNSVDIFGADTGIPYSFIAQADVTASGNAASITIQGVYASGVNKNVTALPANDAVITFKHTASKTYQTVLFWDKQAFVTATAKIKPLSNSVSVPTEGKIMNLLGQEGGNILTGQDIVRFDTLIGFQLLYRNMVSRVDIEVA